MLYQIEALDKDKRKDNIVITDVVKERVKNFIKQNLTIDVKSKKCVNMRNWDGKHRTEDEGHEKQS